ncbi:MAG: HD-GYP domain-containing protein [Spirochaetaceae bacterium]|jgi:HD-GYP domain-containing protein (c-di-GMP phosphodiesterase class II)|nr:HD-GYP domain-containing protein [Spirochaetaceae bacterium]
MKAISVQTLQEGTLYSTPLYADGAVFLPANVALTHKDIAMLHKIGVNEVFTDGRPLTVEAGKTEAETESELEKTRIFARMIDVIRIVDKVFKAVAASVPVKPRIMWTVIAQLMQMINENRAACVEFILGNKISTYDLAKSAINTAILTAIIALELKVPEQMLPELVSAAVLHDVGMLRIPRAVLDKHTPLTAEEKLVIQRHAILSFQIVQDEMRYPQTVAQAVLQHHERWDGLGYPQRFSGTDIDKFASIIAVADSFEAMVCTKPYRNSITAYKAMKTMLSENSSHFSPRVLRAFVKMMGIYPVGSGVVLNNGLRAKVQANNHDAPLRPVLTVIADAAGKKVAFGEQVDLLTNKTLYITTTFDPHSI